MPDRSIRADAITPILGGVGAMTIVSLRHNTPVAVSTRRGLGFRSFGKCDTFTRLTWLLHFTREA
ncbi:hypothetical protein HJB81_10365 [Rhizobium sp. NZLR1]|nr:hypothetical protein [Rhizobium sp. NZLR1]MBX5155903.1 hypothetical protein [Rhizobium sp. NZLR8]MBX5192762.1 hypothetical protein [Rhizobium sp. NZLR3b]MBX5195907.1 hypothetical protein [Rhizobium sp. NZLR10]MBX5201783.1 hypothetical protein [Rhizobium sp. NZLR1]QSZ24440.1 hypothetical protein J3O30_27205 [Rhizobium sp. NZLR1]